MLHQFNRAFASIDQDVTLADNSVKPTLRIVVAGEKSAGKTTLVRALARNNVLSDLPEATAALPVVLRHSAIPYLALQNADGKTVPIDNQKKIPPIEKDAVLLVGANLPHLTFAEIVELPFFHGAEVSDDTLDLMNSADVLVWVTIASQAWRLSEKSILERMNAAQGQTKMLAVSRGDKLRSSKDKDKILSRLEKETEGLFEETFLLHASPKLIQDSKKSDAAWEKTKGQDMFDKLKAIWAPGKKKPKEAAEKVSEPEVVEDVKEDVKKDDDGKVVNLNSRRKAEKTGFELRDAPDEFAPMVEYCETLTGLVSVGVVDFKNHTAISFIEDSTFVLSVADICKNWIETDQKLNVHDVGELTTELTVDSHFLIQRRLPEHDESLFLFCKTEELNPSLARRAFMRLGGYLNEIRS